MTPFPAPVLSALRELSALPYENLSKIAAHSLGGNMEGTVGLAGDWLARARETGAGGTCFSLTWWLAGRLRAAGIPYALLMGGKGRAANVHCALRLDWGGRACLLDPGYLIFDPLPLPAAGLSVDAWIPPNAVRLEALPSAWRLWSGPRGALKFRFDFRAEPVGEAEFFAHWEDSYRWPMMRYPVANVVREGVQYYLQKRNLLVRTPAGGTLRKLGRDEMLATLQADFGVPEALSREALAVVTAADPDFFRK